MLDYYRRFLFGRVARRAITALGSIVRARRSGTLGRDLPTSPAPVLDCNSPLPVRGTGCGASTRYALLSYITYPFRLPSGDPRLKEFSNVGIARSIVRVLREMGYKVDVIEWTDNSWSPTRLYDLFIGHGGCNFQRIAHLLPSRTVKIYFSTGRYWREHNDLEEARFRDLERRRGIRLSRDRRIEFSEEEANTLANGIICLGNGDVADSYRKFPLVISLNSAAVFDPRPDFVHKDFYEARRHFLFFAGPGNVHKGLDLVLEAFAGSDAELHICQVIKPDFRAAYRRELQDLPNIHLHGPVLFRGEKHYELVDRCAFAISASCSEGSPGAMIECIHQGLIPVVSRHTGIDVSDFGIVLEPCTIQGIRDIIHSLRQRPPEWCAEMSARARAAALRDFSEATFLKNLRMAIERITEYAHARTRPPANPFFVDSARNVSRGHDALGRLTLTSDRPHFRDGCGICEVPLERWQEAQEYEATMWMTGAGLRATEDRNREHAKGFDDYRAIRGLTFRNAIELGCGPFTNMIPILRNASCRRITLLDPLIDQYLTHPHCAYPKKRLAGSRRWKVRTVSSPIEEYHTDERYDLVVIINVLEHCYLASAVFNKVLSLTAPGGIVVFHDKLVPVNAIRELAVVVYDAGHPLRVPEEAILSFLNRHFEPLYTHRTAVVGDVYSYDALYFIGRKR